MPEKTERSSICTRWISEHDADVIERWPDISDDLSYSLNNQYQYDPSTGTEMKTRNVINSPQSELPNLL